MIFLEIVFVMCIITIIITPFAIELAEMFAVAREMELEMEAEAEDGIY